MKKSYMLRPEMLTPYDPRHVPLRPPAAHVFDPPLVRLCINTEWISHIDGMISRLLYRDAWVGTDEEVHAAIGEVQALLATFSDIREDCETMAITAIRVTGCNLEVQYNDNPAWILVGDLTSCTVPGPQGEKGDPGDPGADGQDGASAELRKTETHIQWRQDDDNPTWANLVALSEITGPQGAQGIQGPAGATGATGAQGPKGDKGDPGTGVSEPSPPVDDDGNENLCGIAVYLVDWNDSIVNDVMQQIDSAVAVAAILLGLGLGTLIGGAALALIYAMIAVGTGQIRAAVTEQVLDDLKCKLYCKLKEQGEYSYSAVLAWANETYAASGTNVGLQVWLTWFNGQYINFNGGVHTQTTVDQRAFIGSASPSVLCATICDECPDEPEEWCHRFTFLGTADGWTVERGAVTSAGVNGVYVNSQTTENVQMSITFAKSRLTGFAIDYDKSANSGANGVDAVLIYDGATQLDLTYWNVGVGNQRYYYKAYDHDVTKILFGINAGTGYGEIVVRQVSLYGYGVNPFGSDNC